MKPIAIATAILAIACVPPAISGQERQDEAARAAAQGDYRKAARLRAEEAAELARTRGNRHPETLEALFEAASALEDLAAHAESARIHERVLNLRLEALERNHPDTLASMRALGRAYFHVGRMAEGVALVERSRAAALGRFGARAPETIDAMSELAAAYTAAGRYGDSLAVSEEVLRLNREIRFEGHPATLAAMRDVAASYRRLGRADLALAMSDQRFAQAATRGEKSHDFLNALQDLGESHAAVGNYHAAAVAMERSVQLRTEVFGERSPMTVPAMVSLTSIYGTLGRKTDQLALATRALAASRAVFGERHVQTEQAMFYLASAYTAPDDAAKATELFERVLSVRTAQYGEGHPATLSAMAAVAISHERAGRLEKAADLALPYATGAEKRRSVGGSEALARQAVFESHAKAYRYFAWVQARAKRAEESFLMLEMGKARALLEGIASQRALRSSGVPEEERNKLADLERRAEALEVRALQARSPDARQALIAERNAVLRAGDAFRAELRGRYPKFAQLSEFRPARASELGAVIEPGAIAVTYGVGADPGATFTNVFAWISDGQGMLHFADLRTFEHLGDLVEAVRRASGHPLGLRGFERQMKVKTWRLAEGAGYRLLPEHQPGPPGAAAARDLAELTTYCARRLLEPMKALLGGKSRWIISPDGPLAQLPFEMLPWGEKGEPAILHADIHYTQSLTVMKMGLERAKEYQALDRRALLAIGNPVYQPHATAPRRSLATPANRAAVTTQLRDLDPLWPNLPGTEREVRAVSALFGTETSVHLGPDATEHNLQALNANRELARYRYLLFSAHGYLSQSDPALSSLVLGLVDRKPGTDGYVTAAEWPSYDLRSDLAVFSACDSGVGQVSSGEGVMGLPFALFVAGNVNTVLTLWPIEDDATVEFMRAFFTRLQAGTRPAKALAETKRQFIREPPARGLSAPHVWAPFILIGPG